MGSWQSKMLTYSRMSGGSSLCGEALALMLLLPLWGVVNPLWEQGDEG